MQAKKRYKVYLLTRYDRAGLGINSEQKELLGTTCAVSPRKAVSQMAYRKKMPVCSGSPLPGDGVILRTIMAEEDSPEVIL